MKAKPTTKAKPISEADPDTLSLAVLFLKRRGIAITRTVDGSNHRNLYFNVDSVERNLSIYSKGALRVGGPEDGPLHQLLQAFVGAVGDKPFLGLSMAERDSVPESDVVARLEALEAAVAEIQTR